MAARWVVMRPVNYASPRVPFVFAIEFHLISFLECVDSIGQIDVMSNQQRLARLQFDDEALMSTPVFVVGEYCGDGSFSLNLKAASLFGERPGQCLVATRYDLAATRWASNDQSTFE